MAFVTRGERAMDFLKPSPSVTERVGPGTYTASSEHRVVHAHAPFSSTAERRMTMASSGNLVTPGPGAYGTPKKPQSSPSGMGVLNQTAPRWRPQKDAEAPGPGQYDLPTAFKIKKRPRSAGHKANVVWFRAPTAPSIPIPSQAHGYEETPGGELVAQKPPVQGYTGRRGDTVGPGGYDVADAARRLDTIAGKGTDFGRSRSQRVAASGQDAAKESMPGPGQYDWAQAADPPPKLKRPMATFVSRVLRAHDKPKNEDEEMPGPGSYDAHLYHALKPKVVPEVLQCFGSTSRRATELSSNNAAGPGPGSYRTNIAPWDQTKRRPLFDANRAPFASSASRFIGKPSSMNDEEAPGPGQYSAPDFITQVARNKFGRGGHFGSTASRFKEAGGGKGDEDEHAPGPGAYEFKQPKFIAGALRKGPSSVFASSSDRFEKIRKEKEQRPAPGQYNVVKDWTAGAKKSNAFATTAQRFGNTAAEATAPGPGAYSAAVGSIEHRIATRPERPGGFGIESRFKENRKALPVGPGTYDPVDPYGGLVKRSFNVTIESGFL